MNYTAAECRVNSKLAIELANFYV